MYILKQTVEVFLPLFVAMSPMTVLPIFLSMTDGMELETARAMSRRAVVTGLVIALAIVLAGQAVFRFLGITVDDLRVAGGLVLLMIAVYDLIYTRERRKESELGTDAGVVPLGTPLIVGPATMTSCIVLADTHGRIFVLVALIANLAIVALLLHHAHRVNRIARPAVVRAFGKVMSLFLAAIAVAMLRHGIEAFVRGS